MERHPVSGALFLNRGRRNIHDAHLAEAGVFQPAPQSCFGGQVVDVAHVGVTVGRVEFVVAFAGNDQRFDHGLAVGRKVVSDTLQVLVRVLAVVEDTHGKHRVEIGAGGQLLELQRQQQLVRLSGEVLDGAVLHLEYQRRIAAHHLSGPIVQHAPAEITVAATDVEHALAAEVYLRGNAVPLPVGAPFGFNVHTAETQWALAPGDELLERFGQDFGIFNRFAGDKDAVFDAPPCFGLGQGVDCRFPLRHVAVAAGFERVFALALQVRGGVGVEEGEEARHWFVGYLVIWLFGYLVIWLFGWLVDWLGGWVVGWLTGWVVGSLVRWLVGSLVGWLVVWLVGWLVVSLVRWLVGSLVRWFVGSLVRWFVGSLLRWFV